MDLKFPINLVGSDEWMDSVYKPELAQGDVITNDGIVLGTWRVVDYDPEDMYSGGRFEFIPDGEEEVKFSEGFDMLDVRVHRGAAMSRLCRAIREWHDQAD